MKQTMATGEKGGSHNEPGSKKSEEETKKEGE
jgi:hypothetical protein